MDSGWTLPEYDHPFGRKKREAVTLLRGGFFSSSGLYHESIHGVTSRYQQSEGTPDKCRGRSDEGPGKAVGKNADQSLTTRARASGLPLRSLTTMT